MRIGLMVDVYLPFVSGVTHAVSLLATELQNRGHTVEIFTSGRGGPGREAVKIHRQRGLRLSGTGYSIPLGLSWADRERLREMDVLHIHHPFGSGRLALRYAAGLAIPLVYTQHTRYDLYARYYLPWPLSWAGPGLARRYLRSFCRRLDGVLVPTRRMRELLRTWGVSQEVEVVPNGINLESFRHPQRFTRSSVGLPDRVPLLIFVGRLGREKNLPFLLEAFARVASRDPRPHLVLIGDGPERGPLQAAAQKQGIAHRVHVLGWQPRDRIPGYLALGHAFVTASLTEVHPLTLLEALGAGLPVAALRNEAMEGVIVEDGNGLLAEPRPEYLAERILELLANDAMRERLSAGASRSAEAYSIQNCASLTLEAYARATKRAQERFARRAGAL